MKLLRLSGSLIALSILLAACGGGGGGGGSSPPVTTPTTAPGGGGGSTPTPSPTNKPTQSPSPTPTQTPSGVPVDKNYALNADEGPQVNGNVGWYQGGTTALWSQSPNEPPVGAFGDTTAGASSGNGFGQMDGMSCTNTQEPSQNPDSYSVHSFVTIYYNGTELAIPSGVAMQNPTEPIAPSKNAPNGHPNDYWEIEQSQCEYNVHTHDFSGLIHIEDQNVTSPNPDTFKTPTSPLPYSPTLQSYLDLWGVQLTPTGITIPGNPGGNLSGAVAIYYGTQGTDKDQKGNYLTDSYVQVSSPSAVPLAWHDTTIIVIGKLPTLPDGKTALPSVSWGVEF